MKNMVSHFYVPQHTLPQKLTEMHYNSTILSLNDEKSTDVIYREF